MEDFLEAKKWEKKIKGIVELNFNGLTRENFNDFVVELKKKRRELEAKDATEIHLFIAGPMQAAVMIGSIFSNWIPVKIYNHGPHSRNYEYWCHISK